MITNKYLKSRMLLFVVITSVVLWDYMDDFSIEEEKAIENEVNTSQLIDFKGLPVNR